MLSRFTAILFAFVGLLLLPGGLILFFSAETVMHEIVGALVCILSAGFLTIAILSDIHTSLQALIKTSKDAAADADRRARAAADVGTERWDTLCTSLDRLENATQRNKPPSNVGEDWSPAAADDGLLKAKCAKCGKTVKAKPDWAGRTGKCPGCGAAIRFATAAEQTFDGIV